jgi:hypothetical protein
MTHQLKDGTTVTLAHHTLDQWREKQKARLLAMGCSARFVLACHSHYTERPSA